VAQAFQWFGTTAMPVNNQGSTSPVLITASDTTSLSRVQTPGSGFSNPTDQTGGFSVPQSAGWCRLAQRSSRFAKLFLTALVCATQSLAAYADNSHVFTSAKESVSDPGDASNAAKKPVRTWLDPLRQSRSRKAEAANAGEQSGDAAAAGDFDLSDYSRAPDAKPSVVNMPGQSPIRATGLTQEPAEPINGEEHIIIPESQTEQAFYPPTTPDAVFSEHPQTHEQHLCWQLLPNGLLYKTYIAGEKEPRMQLVSYYDTKSKRKIWEAVLGGRAGLIRLSDPSISNSDAFQLDLEGAVFARVLPEEVSAMLEGSDYRVGLYGTWKFDRLSYRAGYYHISAHVGDEYLIANPLFTRINYVRDSLLAGTAWEMNDSSRIYGEIGYALGIEGGAKPLEFQFGAEYTPLPTTQFTGAPFAAVNTHLREDFDFNGGVNVVAGWGWQGEESKRRLRLGLNYYNGPSLQYEFFDRWENLVGGGIWLDY
jgi:hypothetical protein